MDQSDACLTLTPRSKIRKLMRELDSPSSSSDESAAVVDRSDAEQTLGHVLDHKFQDTYARIREKLMSSRFTSNEPKTNEPTVGQDAKCHESSLIPEVGERRDHVVLAEDKDDTLYDFKSLSPAHGATPATKRVPNISDSNKMRNTSTASPEIEISSPGSYTGGQRDENMTVSNKIMPERKQRSKVAQIELNKDTQRLERRMALAPVAKKTRKIALSSILAKFGFDSLKNQSTSPSQQQSHPATCESLATDHNFRQTPDEIHFELPKYQNSSNSHENCTNQNPGSQMTHDIDSTSGSGSDLEIIVTDSMKPRAVDTLRSSRKSEDSHIMTSDFRALQQLAHISSPNKSRKKIQRDALNCTGELDAKSLNNFLLKKAADQARTRRLERDKELEKMGFVAETLEDRVRSDLEVENLIDKELERSEKVKHQEKIKRELKKRNEITEDKTFESDCFGDDESDDESICTEQSLTKSSSENGTSDVEYAEVEDQMAEDGLSDDGAGGYGDLENKSDKSNNSPPEITRKKSAVDSDSLSDSEQKIHYIPRRSKCRIIDLEKPLCDETYDRPFENQKGGIKSTEFENLALTQFFENTPIEKADLPHRLNLDMLDVAEAFSMEIPTKFPTNELENFTPSSDHYSIETPLPGMPHVTQLSVYSPPSSGELSLTNLNNRNFTYCSPIQTKCEQSIDGVNSIFPSHIRSTSKRFRLKIKDSRVKTRSKEKVEIITEKPAQGEQPDYIDDQAEESNDDYAGLGGCSDEDLASDDNPEEVLNSLIDNDNVEDLNEDAITDLHRKREIEQDQHDIKVLMRDLQKGNLRKRTAGYMSLSDSEDESLALERQKLRKEEMRRKLLNDGNLDILASNKNAEAFLQTIEYDGAYTETFLDTVLSSPIERSILDLAYLPGKDDSVAEGPTSNSAARQSSKESHTSALIKKKLSFLHEDKPITVDNVSDAEDAKYESFNHISTAEANERHSITIIDRVEEQNNKHTSTSVMRQHAFTDFRQKSNKEREVLANSIIKKFSYEANTIKTKIGAARKITRPLWSVNA